jgi:hypothetical protein
MPSSTAVVATEKPVPYMKQLCKHFGHKIEARFTEEDGEIVFGMGVCRLDATGADALVLHATSDDDAGLERLEGVVGSHLERFGKRDALAVAWARD